MTLDELMQDISTLDENATVEVLRSKIADVNDTLYAVRDDIEGYKVTIDDLTKDIDEMRAEIDRLKEENGRLFRERVTNNIEDTIGKIDGAIDEEAEISALKENIIL